MTEDKALIAARWDCYLEQSRIMRNKNMSERDKLEALDAACALHCSLHGDVEVYPATHPVRISRETMLKELPAMIAHATQKQNDQKKGATSFFDML